MKCPFCELKGNEEMFRFLMVLVLISAMLIIAMVSGIGDYYIGDSSLYDPFVDTYTIYPYGTLSDLMDDMRIDSTVKITSTVGRILEDYTSKSGYVYQQFYIQEGDDELKVFCSTYKGRTDISEGDTVSISGTLQEYYGELEIYTECREIKPA